MEKPRKLTPHDLAFGIGRKATDEEIKELLSRPQGDGLATDQAMAEIKRRLELRKIKKAS